MPPAERVLGIGGVFFRTLDPTELPRRCDGELGTGPAPDEAERQSCFQQAGPTVFAPFPAGARLTANHGVGARRWLEMMRRAVPSSSTTLMRSTVISAAWAFRA